MRIILIAGFCVLCLNGFSQDDLLGMLDSQQTKKEPVLASFKTTRLINTHTIEVVRRGQLDFRITHRFGDFGGNYGGPTAMFGLDNSSDIRLALEYGFSDRFCVGFGRSKFNQLLDGYLKYRVLMQTTDNKIPVSVTVFANTGFSVAKKSNNNFPKYIHRFSYTTQLLIARKFSDRFSLQLMPTFLHRNYVYDNDDENNLFVLGTAGRFKITKRFAIVVDYFHLFSPYRDSKKDLSGNKVFYPPLGLGVEVETGGHVFSINFTNAPAAVENNYLVNTQSNWLKGQFRFGFNISRQFPIIKPADTVSSKSPSK